MTTDMDKLGTFSQPSYINIGDEYDKKQPAADRHKGKGFTCCPGKKGAMATFNGTFQSLHEGDKYVDPGTHEKKYRIEQEKKKLTADGFKFTSPGKKSSGAGASYGCFGKPFNHQTEYDVLQKGELPEKGKPQLRNIVTNPAKKGTFGTPCVGLGKQGTEMSYISDPFDAEHRKELSESRDAQKKVVGPPFKSACRRQGTFDETGATGASKIFSLDRALPPKKFSGPAQRPPLPVPFKPSSPGKKGFNCTINKFPDYKEDPLEIQERMRREEAKKAKPSTVWKPISGPKSTPCRGVAMTTA